MTPVRYAILHHTGVPAPHYDLLIERMRGGPLRAWRSPSWPISERTDLEPLPDHRQHYLTYEGPITGDRGHVARVAGGECVVNQPSTRQLIVAFPEASQGTVTLNLSSDDRWYAAPVRSPVVA